MKKYSTTLSEQIADEIRNWFKEYHSRVGKFPEFPTEENGGSRQLLSRQGNRIYNDQIFFLLFYSDSLHFRIYIVS